MGSVEYDTGVYHAERGRSMWDDEDFQRDLDADVNKENTNESNPASGRATEARRRASE